MKEAAETGTLSDTGQPQNFTDQDAARIVALSGQDTRPASKLLGINGKPMKIPKIEETLYLLYLEVSLIRRTLAQIEIVQRNQGGR